MDRATFDALERTLEAHGIDEFLRTLEEGLIESGQFASLFDVLLLVKRREMGLPPEGTDDFRGLSESEQVEVENAYVALCRRVGGLFLARGDIEGAWPYFRAIDEPEPIADALETWNPSSVEAPAEGAPDRFDALVDIAIKEGAHPARGFEFTLERHGICRAVTLFEHGLPSKRSVLERAALALVRALHSELIGTLRAQVRRKEGADPAEPTVAALLDSRPSLLTEGEVHLDLSHARVALVAASTVESPEAHALALDCVEYVRRLPREGTPQKPPFEDFPGDLAVYLKALSRSGVPGALRYFRSKAERASTNASARRLPAEALVILLDRLGLHAEALEAHVRYLSDARELGPMVPTIVELSAHAGDYRPLIEAARSRGDVVQFTLAQLKRADAR